MTDPVKSFLKTPLTNIQTHKSQIFFGLSILANKISYLRKSRKKQMSDLAVNILNIHS